MRFRSDSVLGSIATMSSLLLLDLKYNLDNDDVDENMKYPPHCLRLGRGMDNPLQD